MRSALLVFSVWLLSSAASAQIEAGSLKLSIDTELLNHTRLVSTYPDDSKETLKFTTVGPAGGSIYTLPGAVGLSLGYAVADHVIPQLHLALGRTTLGYESSFDDEYEDDLDDDSDSFWTLAMRPELEVAFNPDDRVVGFATGGVDFRYQGVEDEDDSMTLIGPTVSLGLHAFALPRASIDLAARYSLLVLTDDDDGKAHVIGVTAGLSLWP
jgi:hypothetical protein